MPRAATVQHRVQLLSPLSRFLRKHILLLLSKDLVLQLEIIGVLL
jgi:hypothetical protein